MKKVLVVAAHPDDELLGVGGTIRLLTNAGIEARALILAEGQTSRGDKRADTEQTVLESLKANAREAAQIVGYKSIDFCDMPDNRMDSIDLLDIIKKVSGYVESYRPDTIFTHHHGDLNIDHRRVCEAVLTACRPIAKDVKRIYAFETPSSTEWNYVYENPFRPNVYFDITKTADAKIKGMACYTTETAAFPHPRSGDALLSLAEYRGSNIGVDMAEGFMLLRELVEVNGVV